MKQRILVPTDFRQSSIRVIALLAQSDLKDFDLLFTHLFYLPDSIQDLLFAEYRVKEYEVISRSFCDHYRDYMKHRKTQEELHQLPVKFFYGNTLALFRNFLDANAITAIAYSPSQPVKQINKASIDVLNVIEKCKRPLINVDELIMMPQDIKPKAYAPEREHSN